MSLGGENFGGATEEELGKALDQRAGHGSGFGDWASQTPSCPQTLFTSGRRRSVDTAAMGYHN